MKPARGNGTRAALLDAFAHHRDAEALKHARALRDLEKSPSAETLRLHAKALRRVSDFKGAQAVLNEALLRFPDDVPLLGEQALLLYFQGEDDRTLTAADAVLDRSPTDEAAIKAKAGTYRIHFTPEDPRLKEAEQLLDSGLGAHPGSALLLAERAALHHHLRQHEDAVRSGRAALERDPGLDTALSIVIPELTRCGQHAEARVLLSRAVALNPEHVGFRMRMSELLCTARGGLDEALEHAREAIRLDPKNSQARQQEVVCRLRAGDFGGAEKAALESRAALPEDLELRLRLCILYVTWGRFEAAHEALSAAESLAPDDEQVVVQRLILLGNEGRWEQAYAAARSGRERHPQSLAVRLQVVILCRSTRRFEEAHRLLAEHPATTPDERLHLNLAECTVLLSEGRFDEALTRTRRAQETHPDDSQLLVLQAWLLANKGDFPGAHERLDRALAMDAYNDFALSTKADAYITQRDLEAARAVLDRALKHYPCHAGLHISQAQLHWLHMRRQEALVELQRALRFEAGNTNALQMTAQLLLEDGRLLEAEDFVEQALRSNSYSMGLLSMRGFLRLFGHEELDEARDDFEEVLRHAPHAGFLARTGLGTIAYQRGDYATAQRRFHEITQAHPYDTTAWVNLAWAHAAAGDPEEANACAHKALELDARSARAYGCLGAVALSQGRFKRGEYYLKRALTLAGHETNARVHLGVLYSRTGRYSEACDFLTQALEEQPLNERAHLELSMVLLKRGHTLRALQHVRQALDIAPTQADPHVAQAVILGEQGKLAEAARHLREALTCVEARQLPRVRTELARTLLAIGDETEVDDYYKEALAELKRVLQETPDSTQALLFQGIAELKLGQARKALKLFQTIKDRRDTSANVLVYLQAAETDLQLHRARERVSSRWRVVLATASLTCLALVWWAFYTTDRLTPTVLAVVVPLLLGLVAVAALLPYLRQLKVANLEAEMTSTSATYESHREIISGPTAKLELPPTATPVGDSRLLEI
ncbi:tetratricopeptide repeat protein [Myxococcaceae bacterium GXIMD 01537]